jgi:hypothetical protein
MKKSKRYPGIRPSTACFSALFQNRDTLNLGRKIKDSRFLNIIRKFYNDSLNNTLLIVMHKSDASRIAGFPHGKKSLNPASKI